MPIIILTPFGRNGRASFRSDSTCYVAETQEGHREKIPVFVLDLDQATRATSVILYAGSLKQKFVDNQS